MILTVAHADTLRYTQTEAEKGAQRDPQRHTDRHTDTNMNTDPVNKTTTEPLLKLGGVHRRTGLFGHHLGIVMQVVPLLLIC